MHQTKRNTTYQLVPPKFPDETTVRKMADPEEVKNFIGKEEHFLDFCEFFEQEIERLGYEDVLQKYLVGDNDIARNIFPRIYHGVFPTSCLTWRYGALSDADKVMYMASCTLVLGSSTSNPPS